MAAWDAFFRLALYKRITIICTTITAVIAAAVAVAHALNAGEPYWVATRGLVRYEIAQTASTIHAQLQENKTRQIQTELQVLQGRIEATRSKISDRELLLQQDGPPAYKQLIFQQLDEMRDQLKQLQTKAESLRHELDGR